MEIENPSKDVITNEILADPQELKLKLMKSHPEEKKKSQKEKTNDRH